VLVFVEGGQLENPEKNLILGATPGTNNKLNPHMTPGRNWEQNRRESSDKDNEPTPRTIRTFEEKPNNDDRKSPSVDNQLPARKPSGPKPSDNNIDRNTSYQKRCKYQSAHKYFYCFTSLYILVSTFIILT